jgi:hypothetical protein
MRQSEWNHQAGSARDEAVRRAIVPPLAELIASKATLAGDAAVV